MLSVLSPLPVPLGQWRRSPHFTLPGVQVVAGSRPVAPTWRPPSLPGSRWRRGLRLSAVTAGDGAPSRRARTTPRRATPAAGRRRHRRRPRRTGARVPARRRMRPRSRRAREAPARPRATGCEPPSPPESSPGRAPSRTHGRLVRHPVPLPGRAPRTLPAAAQTRSVRAGRAPGARPRPGCTGRTLRRRGARSGAWGDSSRASFPSPSTPTAIRGAPRRTRPRASGCWTRRWTASPPTGRRTHADPASPRRSPRRRWPGHFAVGKNLIFATSESPAASGLHSLLTTAQTPSHTKHRGSPP
jgi:hypothetical protein